MKQKMVDTFIKFSRSDDLYKSQFGSFGMRINVKKKVLLGLFLCSMSIKSYGSDLQPVDVGDSYAQGARRGFSSELRDAIRNGEFRTPQEVRKTLEKGMREAVKQGAYDVIDKSFAPALDSFLDNTDGPGTVARGGFNLADALDFFFDDLSLSDLSSSSQQSYGGNASVYDPPYQSQASNQQSYNPPPSLYQTYDGSPSSNASSSSSQLYGSDSQPYNPSRFNSEPSYLPSSSNGTAYSESARSPDYGYKTESGAPSWVTAPYSSQSSVGQENICGAPSWVSSVPDYRPIIVENTAIRVAEKVTPPKKKEKIKLCEEHGGVPGESYGLGPAAHGSRVCGLCSAVFYPRK